MPAIRLRGMRKPFCLVMSRRTVDDVRRKNAAGMENAARVPRTVCDERRCFSHWPRDPHHHNLSNSTGLAMTKRLELEAGRGDEFRLMCPDCKSTWTTLRVPAGCPTCDALVTFRVIAHSEPGGKPP